MYIYKNLYIYIIKNICIYVYRISILISFHTEHFYFIYNRKEVFYTLAKIFVHAKFVV